MPINPFFRLGDMFGPPQSTASFTPQFTPQSTIEEKPIIPTDIWDTRGTPGMTPPIVDNRSSMDLWTDFLKNSPLFGGKGNQSKQDPFIEDFFKHGYGGPIRGGQETPQEPRNTMNVPRQKGEVSLSMDDYPSTFPRKTYAEERQGRDPVEMPPLPPRSGYTPSYLPDKQGPNATDEFIREASNMPVRERPSWMRILGTGLYSTVRETPRTKQETVQVEAAVPGRNIKYTAPDGTVSYKYIEGTPEQRRTVTVRGGGEWSPLNVEEAENILSLPYNKKVEDWKNRAGGLEKASQQERLRESAEGLNQKRVNDAIIAERRESRQYQADRDKQQFNLRKIELSEWLADHPNLQLIKQPGDNIRIFDPRSGQMQDTGIPTGTLTDEQEIERMIQGRLRVVREQGGQTRQNIQERQEATEDTPLLPGQEATLVSQRARQLLNQYPKQLKGLIEIDQRGNVTVKPAGDSWFGKDFPEDLRQRVLDYLYPSGPRQVPTRGGSVTTTAPGGSNVTPQTAPGGANKPPPPAPPGWKWELRKDGKGYTAVPADR